MIKCLVHDDVTLCFSVSYQQISINNPLRHIFNKKTTRKTTTTNRNLYSTNNFPLFNNKRVKTFT